MTEPLYFQWQNDFLLKTIYPLREVKLRDFLVYYAEVDIWAQYKGKDIASLASDVEAYTKAQDLQAVIALKTYNSLRKYFSQPDVCGFYIKFKPIDENELKEINNLHAMFMSVPGLKDAPTVKQAQRELGLINEQLLPFWTEHRRLFRDQLKSKRRRVENMDPAHEKLPAEKQQLAQMETITGPMIDQEMEQMRAFKTALENVDKFKLQAKFAPTQPITVQDIARWKASEYADSLKDKNQYQLLEEIIARFRKEPKRYPYWLQYMVVHFSGMRYASAHSSWADPKDLIIRLRASKMEQEAKGYDDDTVAKKCAEKIAVYESAGGAKPKLASATEAEWKGKLSMNLQSLKASGPKTRRNGLTALLMDEVSYEARSLTTQQALDELKKMKDTFPKWAWKEIVKLTPLRVTEVADLNWEKLTPEEDAARNSQENMTWRMLMDGWENADASGWREEHGRTHELIVSRAVCNETAEHCQHIRGNLPPGGLAAKPKWYKQLEADAKTDSHFIKPKSLEDYTPGASILWLRFVDREPDHASQAAKPVETKDKVGLLPKEFLGSRKPSKDKPNPWLYKPGEITTRTRTIVNPDKTKTTQLQWLRWIHEATVAEVAETVDGPVVLTFETALPDGDPGLSAVGFFRLYPEYVLSDGTEDNYNRSFLGYTPEGQLPMEHLKDMLDWNKVLRKQVV
jgi:hypothetical protein